jgi:hypothetical protein
MQHRNARYGRHAQLGVFFIVSRLDEELRYSL